MKTVKTLFLSALVLLVSSCSDDDDQKPALSKADLIGSWKATSILYTNNSNSAETYELIANGGDVSYTMLDNGGVRTWVTFGDFSDEWDAASLFSGSTVTLTPVESTRPTVVVTIEMLDKDSFVATNTNDSFDFSLEFDAKVSVTSITTWVRK